VTLKQCYSSWSKWSCVRTQTSSLSPLVKIFANYTLLLENSPRAHRRQPQLCTSCIGVWQACSCVTLQMWQSTGLRFGLLGAMYSKVSRRSNAIHCLSRCRLLKDVNFTIDASDSWKQLLQYIKCKFVITFHTCRARKCFAFHGVNIWKHGTLLCVRRQTAPSLNAPWVGVQRALSDDAVWRLSVWRLNYDICLTSVAYIRSAGGVCGRPAGWRVLADRAGLAQGCRCGLPLQAWAGAYRVGRPPTACFDKILIAMFTH